MEKTRITDGDRDGMEEASLNSVILESKRGRRFRRCVCIAWHARWACSSASPAL